MALLGVGVHDRLATAARVTAAFMYGVLLGVLWELASMSILLFATLCEFYLGTLVMVVIFAGTAAACFAIASRADLARPLLSILIFRLSAQIAMTLGTGSLILTTVLSDTPACASSRLRTSGWRAPVVALLKRSVPRKWLRRVVGVDPPYGPPFLRILAAVASELWFSWVPDVGLPSILTLPGSITFRPDQPAVAAARASPSGTTPLPEPSPSFFPFNALFPGEPGVTGVYTYACRDMLHHDFYYIFRYQKATWLRPASLYLLHAIVSLCIKMLLMHTFASLFMLLSQGNCREAFAAEVRRRADRVHRWLKPRPPVRLIPIEPGDVCAFCHEELLKRPPSSDDADEQAGSGVALRAAAVAAATTLYLRQSCSSALAWIRRMRPAAAEDQAATTPAAEDGSDAAANIPSDLLLHCRWGCGRAVHRACADAWGRNACVFCAAPMH